MEPFTSALVGCFLFVIGATIGSFLNVVIYRLPRGESISHPGSHCPNCGRALTWLPPDLIPILSWVFLRGRCRSCGTRISGRYAGVELLTALLFLAAGWSEQFVPNAGMAHKLVFVGLAIPIVFIDIDHRIVPDELSVPLLALGLLWNGWDAFRGEAWLVSLNTHGAPALLSLTLPTSIVFATICAGIFWLIQWFGEIAFRREAMGLGDVNIAAAVGANLPILAALLSFGVAIAIGTLIGIPVLLLKRKDANLMAFGPMLLSGALLLMLFPQPFYQAVTWYRALLP